MNRPLSLLLPSKALLCYFVLFPARCQLSSASFFSPRFALLHSSGNQKQKKRKENRLDQGGGRRGSFPSVKLFAALPASRYETLCGISHDERLRPRARPRDEMPSYARLRDGGEREEAGFAARPLWPQKQEDAEEREAPLCSQPAGQSCLHCQNAHVGGKAFPGCALAGCCGLVYAVGSVLSGQDVDSVPLLLLGLLIDQIPAAGTS